MLLNILLSIHILVCVLLAGVVLLQRSEGGALGMGGGPSGFMTARGTGDLLTRSTWILFTIFLVLSIILTILAGHDRSNSSVAAGGDIGRVDPGTLVPTAPAPADSAPAVPAPQVRGLPAPASGVTTSAVDAALGAPAQTPPSK